MKKDRKISKKMTIGKIVEEHPELAELLMDDYGLHCIGCMAAGGETLEEGAKAHGMRKGEIDKMVKDLSQVLVK